MHPFTKSYADAGIAMNVQTAAAVGAALVALAFAMSTFERWLGRHRRHELAWSVSLLMFSLASASLAAGASVGWNGLWFRLFYFFGAIANVPFLALGTIYLLAGNRRGDRWAAAIALFSAFAAGVIVVAPFTAALPEQTLAQGSDVFGPLPRILAATASAAGALVVIGGALWSAWRLWRSGHGSGRFVLSNSVIAAGTLITGASGILNSVVDQQTAFAVTLLIGITVIFAGFLVATSAPRPVAPLSPELAAAPAGATSPSTRAAATAPR
ncbi:MAG: hypothetical protein QOG64_2273 [Acidimicrobiaceae bacterium]|nr:hypothetical protein [Acidimicrobiaceae bacterium]